SVPTSARTNLLHFLSLSVNERNIPAAAADGLQFVNYLGDANGDGAYTQDDAQRLARVVAGLDRGFAIDQGIDPLLPRAGTGIGTLSGRDAARILQFVAGQHPPEIPPLPAPPSAPAPSFAFASLLLAPQAAAPSTFGPFTSYDTAKGAVPSESTSVDAIVSSS